MYTSLIWPEVIVTCILNVYQGILRPPRTQQMFNSGGSRSAAGACKAGLGSGSMEKSGGGFEGVTAADVPWAAGVAAADDAVPWAAKGWRTPAALPGRRTRAGAPPVGPLSRPPRGGR